MQAQESKEGEQEEPCSIDDIGQPIMELYVTRKPDGSLGQQASVLRPVPPPSPEEDGSVSVVGSPDSLETFQAVRSITGGMDMSGARPCAPCLRLCEWDVCCPTDTPGWSYTASLHCLGPFLMLFCLLQSLLCCYTLE